MKVLTYARKFAYMMFTDKMDIYRHGSQVTEHGATEIGFPEEPTYTNVPCRLSWSELESLRNNDEDYTPIEVPIKVFCAYNTDIQPGDYVIANVYSGKDIIATYKGICADAATHESHKELYLNVKEPA